MNKYMSKFSDEQKNEVFSKIAERRNQGIRRILADQGYEDIGPDDSEWTDAAIQFDQTQAEAACTDWARFDMIGYKFPTGRTYGLLDDIEDARAWCEAAEAAYADWGDRILGRHVDGKERDPREWRLILDMAMRDVAPCVPPGNGSTQLIDFRQSRVTSKRDVEGKVKYVIVAAGPWLPITPFEVA